MQQDTGPSAADYINMQQPAVGLFPRFADYQRGVPACFRRTEGLYPHGNTHDARSEGERPYSGR